MMRVLLDTHIMLWSMCGDPRLSSAARAVIEDESNELYFSSASLCDNIAQEENTSRTNAGWRMRGEEGVRCERIRGTAG